MTKSMAASEWRLLAHPAFQMEFDEYKKRAVTAISKFGGDWMEAEAGKQFVALKYLVFERIPSNPGNPEFRLGNALGETFRHWFKGKFFQQYRVFFRYSTRSEIIAYGWVNDDETLRAYGSKTDAYLVFKKMLESGKVPNNWDELVAESKRLS
jgi:toxin YhaV